LIEESEGYKEKVAKELLETPPVQSGRAALAEIELGEEVGYTAVIDVFNQAYSFLLNSRLQKLKREGGPLSEHEKHVKRLEFNIERLRFLFTVANINCQLMDYAFAEDAGKESRSCVKKEIGPEFREEVDEVVFDWKGSAKLENGAKRLYYPSGALKAESYYLNGLLHGPSHWYTEEKVLLAESTFIDGKQEGEALWYYPSGALYSRQNFSNGLLDGEQTYYYEDGSTKTHLHYVKGQLTKSALLYDRDQSLKREIIF
jgi:hypothetical protein